MDYIKNTDQAGFIKQHGTDVYVVGEWSDETTPLKNALAKIGVRPQSIDKYQIQTRAQATIQGPEILLILEDRVGLEIQINSWTTVFVITNDHNIKEKFWRHRESRSFECFYWTEYRWVSQEMQGQKTTFLKPFSKDADKLFQEQILGVHPELVNYWHRIYPVYAGASEHNAIDRVPHLELLGAIETALGRGKDKVIFSNADEALQPQSINKAHRIIDQLNYMPANTWFMLTSTLDGTASYHKMCKIMGVLPKMKIISGMRFENVTKSSMVKEWHGTRTLDFTKHPVWKDLEFVIGKREKKLLCFNRMPRWQRARMVGFLFEHNLIDNSYVSFDINNNDEAWSRKEAWADLENSDLVDEEFRGEPYLENIYKHWDKLPLVLNRSSERDNPVDINIDDVRYFDNSYFSVVNETNFYHSMLEQGSRPCCCMHTDGVFISEKVYKPIAHRHPFIVAGLPGTLKFMRVVGYKTFDGIFNEDYDTIEDDNTRLEAIEKEILRLTNLTDNEWVELQVQLKPIIDYNYKHFLALKKLNTTDYDLVAQF